MEDRIEERLTERHAVFELRDLYTVALEQTAGELSPREALDIARTMVRDRRILTLEGGRMTTLAVRAQEQAIERRAANLAKPADRDVGHAARATAMREVAERIGGQFSDEQEMALLVLTGPERASVLVGPAGTGKGVVIDAAARAEQLAGMKRSGSPSQDQPPSDSAPTVPPSKGARSPSTRSSLAQRPGTSMSVPTRPSSSTRPEWSTTNASTPSPTSSNAQARS